MKIKINTDLGFKEVEIKGLRGKHKKEFLLKITEVSKIAKEKDISAIGKMSEFLDFQDNVVIEVSNICGRQPPNDLDKKSIEFTKWKNKLDEENRLLYEDLELEEQNKLVAAVRKIMFPQSDGENLF